MNSKERILRVKLFADDILPRNLFPTHRRCSTEVDMAELQAI